MAKNSQIYLVYSNSSWLTAPKPLVTFQVMRTTMVFLVVNELTLGPRPQVWAGCQ